MKKTLITIILTAIAWVTTRDLEQMAFGLMITLPVFYAAIGKERKYD